MKTKIFYLVLSKQRYDAISIGKEMKLTFPLVDYWAKRLTGAEELKFRRGPRGPFARYHWAAVHRDDKNRIITLTVGKRVLTEAERMRQAEFKVVSDLMQRGYNGRQRTLDDVFTHEERLRMAYVPVILAEVIWEYVTRVTDHCRIWRIPQFKKLCRGVAVYKDNYYNGLRKTIDRQHIESAKAAARDFTERCGADIARVWFTIRTELMKNYDIKHLDMITDAHLAILLVRALKKFCLDVEMDIRHRLHTSADVETPVIFLRDLDVIMDGYVGYYEIDRTPLIQRCEAVVRSRLETIKYQE